MKIKNLFNIKNLFIYILIGTFILLNINYSYANTYAKSSNDIIYSPISYEENILTAELGFSVTGSTKLSKSYNVNVPKGKKINLKVFVNNKKYSYSVYKDNKYQGTGTATKPIGLVFKQYVYNK